MTPVRKVLFSLMAVVVLGTANVSMAASKTIKLASEEWETKANADGTGLYWDLVDEVYKRADIKVERIMIPYSRSVSMTESGEVDGWLGSYIDEEDWAVFPEYGLDVDRVAALISSKDAADWQGQKSLEGKRVVWMRDYDYDSYLDVKVDFIEIDDLASAIALIKRGRAVAYLDDRAVTELAMKSKGLDVSGLEMKDLMELTMYVAFKDDANGRELAKIYTEQFKAMLADGTVEKLFAKHNMVNPFK